ncbi:MAG: acetyl-CoA carboxylase carboxyltransferase subunit alpha [Elusimicrobiota bacterium]
MDNSSNRIGPDFEQPVVKIIEKIDKEKSKENPDFKKLDRLKKEKNKVIKEVYKDLNSWQRVQLARHPNRPHTMDYIKGIFEDFLEFHGDRKFGDDKAIVGGVASLNSDSVMVIGHQKGESTEDNLKRNFGMPHPEGYRKSLRLMQLAEKFSMPVITFVDTPGAYPGIEAEERGQSEAIATNLKEMINLKTGIITVIIGEGGSGGALGIGVGDKLLMLENSVYFVCTPEACSAILWNDAQKASQAAETMGVTARDLKDLGVIDKIIEEPPGGAHWNYGAMFEKLKKNLTRQIGALKRTTKENLFEKRFKKFRNIGVYNKVKK